MIRFTENDIIFSFDFQLKNNVARSNQCYIYIKMKENIVLLKAVKKF